MRSRKDIELQGRDTGLAAWQLPNTEYVGFYITARAFGYRYLGTWTLRVIRFLIPVNQIEATVLLRPCAAGAFRTDGRAAIVQCRLGKAHLGAQAHLNSVTALFTFICFIFFGEWIFLERQLNV